MKKTVSILIIAVFLLSWVPAAFAAGGPPKGVVTGKFISVDPAAKTSAFMKSGADEAITIHIGDAVKADEIPIDKKVMVSLDKVNGNDTIKDISIMFIGLPLSKVISLLIIGLVGGMLSGFIGSGGAFVLTPAMMSLGVPGAVAVASNMCHKFPKAMVGAFKRYKYGQVDVKLGVVMAASAIIGVQIGIHIQKFILNSWGNAGSNLYVSLVFVVVLVIVGGYVFRDALKLSKGGEEASVSKLAIRMQKINIPPMMHFKTAGIRISAWITIPIGLATGMLAATIAVGGFIGVPGLIYVLGSTAIVASASELVVAFIMGLWGSTQWAMSGLVDIRLTLLILAGSLFGVQIGALGTTYVKDYVIKIAMGSVMLIVAISRGAKIPVYLSDLNLMEVSALAASRLNFVSFWSLIAALSTCSLIISVAMIKGMLEDRAERMEHKVLTEAEAAVD